MGFEDFEEVRTMGYYYVDKTGLIMSMLKYFFETGRDGVIFDGLNISKEKELCDNYMGKFPVISISLKNVSGNTYDNAMKLFCSIMGMEALRFPCLK